MKKVILLSVFALFAWCLQAQNLVPNPSFEDTISCPQFTGQVSNARYWQTVANTPDYFHECSPVWQISVPQNLLGYQWPHTGSAYMGLIEYTDAPGNPADSMYREVIGTNLITPMIIGEKYFVNFKACLAFNPSFYDVTAASKLGILFSTVNYLSNALTQINYCQIYIDSILRDSINWTTIRGSFIADSAYSFISIGNFFMNYFTDTVHFLNTVNGASVAYYYIDDVCVSTDSLYSEVWTTLPENVIKGNISVFPNPAINKIVVDDIPFDCRQIELFDLQGKLVQTFSIKHNFNITIDISYLSDGMYSLIFRKEKSIRIKKFIKSHL